MSSPSDFYLFLLLLPLVVLVVAFAWRAARRYANGRPNLIPRVLRLFLCLRTPASRIFRALTLREGQSHPTMSDPPVSREDEGARWRLLVPEAEATIEKCLSRTIDIELASFIRCVTFRVFAMVFLGVDLDPGEPAVFAKLQGITGALSAFYDDGQGRSSLHFDIAKDLNEWLPRGQFQSPLVRILPAYEALWRIIATIVVICEDDETKALRWVMLDLRDNPRDRQYSASFGNSKSASVITEDAVRRLTTMIARPGPQHHADWSLGCIRHAILGPRLAGQSPPQNEDAPSPDWPLGCIQHAIPSHRINGQAPTEREGKKFAALVAAMIIGRVGVHYGISGAGDGGSSPQGSPWNERRIFRINHTPPSVVEKLPYGSTSRQAH